MKNKSALLFLPIVGTALWSMVRLSGFPGEPHLTPARLLFMLLIAVGCIVWLLFFRSRDKILTHKDISSVLFHISLLFMVISVLFIISTPYLMKRDGILYSIGAFIRQAQPFLVFLIVCCFCSIWLIIITQKGTGTFSFCELVFADTFISYMKTLW